MAYRKHEFTEKEMPAVFRIMHMLGIEMDDLKTRFEKFKKSYTA
jgi:GntR family transcriptional regulator